MSKYYLGLDMGTSTVGWAVTDNQYNLIRKKGKDLWGVREFEEAKTSAERRTHRINRRRRQREQVRIGLLKSYFDEAIHAVDPAFYIRLENSKYHLEDKDDVVKTPNGIFDDKNYTDKEYFAEFPTIFHLRKALIEGTAPQDVRLVFLAILNMYKHRGHFLNGGATSEETGELSDALLKLYEQLEAQFEISLPDIGAAAYEEILSDRKISRSVKAEQLCALLGIEKKQKQAVAIIKTICGLKGDAKVIFDEEFKEKVTIEFSSFGYDDKEPEIAAAIGEERFELIEAMKAVYNIGALAAVLKGFQYLSEARVKDYEKHGDDLRILKSVVKEYKDQAAYDKLFRSEEPGSYSAYVNSVSYDKLYETGEKSKHRRNMKGRSRDDFYKTVKDLLKGLPDTEETLYIKQEIELETFMPKQLTASNGVIPYQVHEKELKAILKKAAEYLPFLNETDESGLTTAERIIRLFSFQIPYYIGPTTTDSAKAGGTGWVIRKDHGEILPWNIDEKIDMKKTSEAFISRMVRRCTYISDEQVLPKSSLMYERYCVLNEINNIRIDGERIPVQLKQDIFHELFERGKKVTRKQLVNYLIGRGLVTEEQQVTGIDVTINNSLSSYGKFKSIFGDELDTEYGREKTENIIFWCTIYGDSKNFLIQNIKEKYPEITDAAIKRIVGMRFKDWGRLSKGFLEMQAIDKETGAYTSLIGALWETQNNLMELLHSDAFTFGETLQEKQTKGMHVLADITFEDLDGYYFSAPVKRMIWQTLGIIKEITQVMGAEPERIFIEMTRSDEEKGDKGRKDSRKKELLESYKGIKDDLQNWKELIEAEDQKGRLRSKKMYLYLTQMGRDMYSGEPIELDQLFNDNLYDIDHIYPRHFVKDDSIRTNLVLVKKTDNAHKSDTYPIEDYIRNNPKVRELWYLLREKKLITEEKYRRLTGYKAFSEEQKAEFIARQLVETGQATKGVADLLKQLLPEVEIVYAKAKNVSDFRNENGLLKTRVVNDFHHAQDAYLNIVVGNVYYTKFTKNPLHYIKKEYHKSNGYHLGKMFAKDVVRDGYCAWQGPGNGSAGTMDTVKCVMKKNTPLITRKSFEAHGGIADQTLYGHKKAKDVGYIPLKSSDERMQDVKKYGGFSNIYAAYFFLVEHEVKGKKVRTIESLPIMYADKVAKNPSMLEQYCAEILKLQNFSVRLRKIKIQSLIRLDGYYVHITGKTGNQLSLRNAVSLCLKENWITYIKKLNNIQEKGSVDKDVTKIKNEALYGELLQKYSHGIFSKRPNGVAEKLRMGQEYFKGLDIEKQVRLLLEVLKLSTLGTLTADLTAIKGASQSGRMLMNKNISNNDEVILITQSITGLYEKHIDLLTI